MVLLKINSKRNSMPSHHTDIREMMMFNSSRKSKCSSVNISSGPNIKIELVLNRKRGLALLLFNSKLSI